MNISCAILSTNSSVNVQLQDLISKVPFLSNEGIFENPAEALVHYYENRVNLYFIGIEMNDDELNGMEFSKLLSPSTRVIFMADTGQYAIDCFRLNALDYLLTSQLTFGSFFEAISKASRWFSFQQMGSDTGVGGKKQEAVPHLISVKSNNRILLIDLADILYIESLGDYVKIHINTGEKPVLCLCSMKQMEMKLPQDDFIRIHRSYIIRKECIRIIGNNTITLDKREIPVGDTYRNHFKNYISQLQVS